MKNTLFDITGRTALVTGAAGLLGIAHAKALLSINCNLILTDVDQTKLVEAKKLLKNSYPNRIIHTFIMDVTSETSICEVVNHLDNIDLRVDILINNAALNPSSESIFHKARVTRLENFSLDQWNLEISVGLTGAFLCSKIFGTAMASDGNGGVILNISSDLSVIAPDQRLYRQKDLSDDLQPVKPITYSVLKTGLIGLTRYLATYWANKGIRTNALSPGGVYTDQDITFVNRLEGLIPMGRMAKKDEYTGAIQFLCSDASAYMNGQNIIIDGGRSAW